MGIPHLLSLLSPHATRFELKHIDPSSTVVHDHGAVGTITQSQGSLTGHCARQQSEASGSADIEAQSPTLINQLRSYVVIDGPGLAYHAYHKALARRAHSSKNALQAMPSYEEVIAVVMEWLETVQTYGFNLRAIYFDGGLPTHKRSVRLERLDRNLKDLSSLRKLYGNDAVDLATLNKPMPPLTASDLFSVSPVPAPFNISIAPPFLVPAVIEALHDSAYGPIIRVVPSEADSFCAAALRSHAGLVLTSDSDLLVHDLGRLSSAVLFRSLSISAGAATLHGALFTPSLIAARLQLPHLAPLAFAVAQRPRANLGTALKAARAPTPQRDARRRAAFDTEYAARPADEAAARLVGALDPRVAEWVVGAVGGDAGPLTVFMPFLVEDPARVAAWAVARVVRCLGYAAVLEAVQRRGETREVWRKGARMAETKVEFLSVESALGVLERDVKVLERLCAGWTGIQLAMRWRAFGVWRVCREMNDLGRVLPRRAAIEKIVKGEIGQVSTDWEYMHFAAMVQAVLYSWRIVKQLFGVVDALGAEYRNEKKWPALRKVHEMLRSMPSIVELFPNASVDIKDIVVLDILSKLYGMLDIQLESESENIFGTPRKKKRKGKQRKPTQGKPTAPSTGSTNMYSLLDENG